MTNKVKDLYSQRDPNYAKDKDKFKNSKTYNNIVKDSNQNLMDIKSWKMKHASKVATKAPGETIVSIQYEEKGTWETITNAIVDQNGDDGK